MKKIKIRLPDNWHAHLRQYIMLAMITRFFNIYGRVLCMGNTSPLIETVGQAMKYRQEILDQDVLFEPAMCIMLTENTTPSVIWEAKAMGIKFVKFIPQATSQGVSRGVRMDDFEILYPIFEAIQETGMHLLIHAELIAHRGGREIHYLRREEAAVGIVAKYRRDFPQLMITVEHASTAMMINFVLSQDSAYLRATLTPQHAVLTYGDVFDGRGRIIDPFNFCLPVAKTERDRLAVRKAMTGGDIHFFSGPDSAVHWLNDKLAASPKPGIFFGEAELPLSVEIFEEEGALSKFEDFHSRTGAEYYGYPLNTGTLTLAQEEWNSPVMEDGIRYSWGGRTMRWRVIERNGQPMDAL